MTKIIILLNKTQAKLISPKQDINVIVESEIEMGTR